MKVDIDEEKNKGLRLKDIVITIICAIVFSVVLMQFVALTIVDGSSMNNTLKDGQHLILNKVVYKFTEPKYKDIVVIKRNDLSVKYLIKRVIAVGGDHLVIKDNKVYVNDTLLEEDYINQDEEMVTNDIDVVIPENKVFVMGDNRNHSSDSRNSIIGFIDLSQICGRIVGNK